MEFRARDYLAEEITAALPRLPVLDHPLAHRPAPSPPQVRATNTEEVDFDDPLRAHSDGVAESDEQHLNNTSRRRHSNEAGHFSSKEWTVFSSLLVQRFSYNNKIPISPTLDVVLRDSKEYGKSLADVHMEELDDPETVSKEEKKVVTRQEYASRLQELKAELRQSWRADDRIRALKLSIKVARLLMDTTLSLFYPTLFVLVIEVLDMLGDLVWERIMRKAEYSDDGTLLQSLPESFVSDDVCSEAKDTCYNWFCKIGSIRELLPRIYLELAILRCWRFLEDDHLCTLHRLTMMMRGLADPLASAYCHLYMAHCAEALRPRDRGYLVTSVSNISILVERMILSKEAVNNDSYRHKKLLITLMEPAIEWIIKCMFIDGNIKKHQDVLVEFGFCSTLSESTDSTKKKQGISIVLHYLLKQFPAEFISMNALEIVELFEQNKDLSLDQHLNYRLLGLKLCECPPMLSSVKALLNQVTEVVNQYKSLDEFLMVVDAYIDIILHYSMDYYLSIVLDGMLQRAQTMKADKTDLDVLQSILVKLINHFDDLEDVLRLSQLRRILGLLKGSSRTMVDAQILLKATRTGVISDPTIIQFLFEISQSLHDSLDISSMEGDQQRSRLISTFIQMVELGDQREQHLTFLIDCRANFRRINGLKDTLVHLCNMLAVKAIKSMKKFKNFLKACVAFNEVTIPSISSNARQMNLYLQTAEVSLLGGLASHAEGLINSAINCLQDLIVTAGFHKSGDGNHVLSLSCKLCSLLVLVPGIHEEGRTIFPRKLMLAVDSHSLLPRMKMKILCSIISLSASLSQNKFPYHGVHLELVGNDQLFYGDASYHQELLSLSIVVVQKLVDAIEEESQSVTRGKLALEACNYLIISFKATHQLHLKCTELTNIAKSCLHIKDKYLESTMTLFHRHFSI